SLRLAADLSAHGSTRPRVPGPWLPAVGAAADVARRKRPPRPGGRPGLCRGRDCDLQHPRLPATPPESIRRGRGYARHLRPPTDGEWTRRRHGRRPPGVPPATSLVEHRVP